jgi:hypothetical protein
MAGMMQVSWEKVEDPTWDCDKECRQQSAENRSLGFSIS